MERIGHLDIELSGHYAFVRLVEAPSQSDPPSGIARDRYITTESRTASNSSKKMVGGTRSQKKFWQANRSSISCPQNPAAILLESPNTTYRKPVCLGTDRRVVEITT